ncbi:DUF2946 family protein [Salinisphaera aquimarina]|uniref:DUF2946 family protein n=1 Tax=Salinisphaera aquimarina TaxID=2094031 RepID=A0ABV7ERL0_9GAMM
MQEWVERAIAKWPNVPALFGWLGLTRRGHWLIQGERITHPRIVDAIANNYACDTHGRWFFQNGPQRGYIALEYTPLIARVQADDRLLTHTGQVIESARALYLDENSAAILDTPDGAALIEGADLAWVLEHLRDGDSEIDDEALAAALATPSGDTTELTLMAFDTRLPVHRCDADALPARLGFVRDPEPRDDEAES